MIVTCPLISFALGICMSPYLYPMMVLFSSGTFSSLGQTKRNFSLTSLHSFWRLSRLFLRLVTGDPIFSHPLTIKTTRVNRLTICSLSLIWRQPILHSHFILTPRSVTSYEKTLLMYSSSPFLWLIIDLPWFSGFYKTKHKRNNTKRQRIKKYSLRTQKCESPFCINSTQLSLSLSLFSRLTRSRTSQVLDLIDFHNRNLSFYRGMEDFELLFFPSYPDILLLYHQPPSPFNVSR